MSRQTPRHHSKPHLLLAGLSMALLTLGGVALLPAVGARPVWQQQQQQQEPRPGAVFTTDGHVLEGEVVEQERDVTVVVRGIATTVPRERVARIEWGTPEERLVRRLEQIPPDNFTARLDIADEAIRRDLLDLAERIANDVLRDAPNHARARTTLGMISQQRQLSRLEGTGRRPARPQEGPPGRGQRPGRENVLNEEQINMVRQAELQEADALLPMRDRPRIAFHNDVLQRYVSVTPNLEFRQFNRLDDVTKALTIIRDGPPEMRQDVRITSDPIGILTYLREVEPVVLNGCATSACHGGAAAENFMLYRQPRDDVATRYTNFYILNTATVEVRTEGGAFGDATVRRRLVDRDAPENSLLLQFMLRPDRATHPHPPVDGYTGMVQTAEAPHYLLVHRWISQSLRRLPGHGYGFEFHPGGAQPQPAGDVTDPDEQDQDQQGDPPPENGNDAPPDQGR